YYVLCSLSPHPPRSTLFPYTTLFRSYDEGDDALVRSSISMSDLGPRREPEDAKERMSRRWTDEKDIPKLALLPFAFFAIFASSRSEEHTSELQSRVDLVCRLLLEKKK